MKGEGTARRGWAVGRSIAMELDEALTAVGGFHAPAALPAEVIALIRLLPADWRQEWPRMLGEAKAPVSVLTTAAYLAGTLADGDYSRATLAIRELDAGEAAARLEKQLNPGAGAAKPPSARLAELLVKSKVGAYTAVGLEMTAREGQIRRLRREMDRVPRLLGGGDLHARFWLWLDRFYYEFYHSWRLTRDEYMRERETRARAVLGASPEIRTAPDLSWLPAPNPILRHPELRAAVAAARLRVFFWVEPFGLFDTWELWPGLLVVSCAEPGPLYERFRTLAVDVAARTKALADPTRLAILRLIRHFGMVNTEIAAFLGLARPTVSIHAKILQQAGLIRSRQAGRVVRHEVVPEAVRGLFRDLADFLDLPDEADGNGGTTEPGPVSS